MRSSARGITGSALALALLREGHDDLILIDAVERSDKEASPLLALGPHATRVLHALGLRGRLSAVALAPEHYLERELASSRIWRDLPLGNHVEARFGAPYLLITRHQLITMLHDSIGQLSGWQRITARVTHTTPNGTFLASGSSTAADLVVLCTGAREVIPGFPAPADASLVQLSYARTSEQALPPALLQAAVTRWIGPTTDLWTMRAPDSDELFLQRSSTHPDPWHERLRPLADQLSWTFHREVGATLSAQWHNQRLLRIGGARGGTPLADGQGAAMALEDAWVLSRLIEQQREAPESIGAALERFRLPRLRQVAAQLARQRLPLTDPGWSKPLHRARALAGDRFLPELGYQRQAWLYGYDCVRGFR